MKLLFVSLLLHTTLSTFAQETKKEQDTIKPKTTNIEEVKVSIKKQFIKVDSDKTTISISNNQMLNTGNAYEALKKLPGVIVSPTGGLSLNGKGVSIQIDGAPSTLSGTDLENYLTSLPANTFEKIELVYNPGASFDANASGSVINLVTGNKYFKGTNASVNLNYGFNKYQKVSPQILLNGKTKNLSWQTMLGYNYTGSDQFNGNNQTFKSFSPSETINQNRLTVSTNRNFYFRLGTNYKLNKKSNLLFNYNGNFANNREVFNSETTGSSISNYYNDGITKDKNNNHEISLQYKTKLDTLGRTLNVTSFTNIFDRNPNLVSNASSNNVNSYSNSSNNFRLLNYYLKYDLSIPFEKSKFSIATGGKLNVLKINNTGNYYLNSPNAAVIDFDYTQTNLAFYTEIRKTIKKLSLTVGLRLEDYKVDRIGVVDNSKTEIDFRNLNLFPNISALYRVNDDVNATVSYSRKIAQPNYKSLDPNGSNLDQYNSAQGNILLTPSFFDNYEFKITALDYIQIGTNYTVEKNHNQFILDANPGELVSTQTFVQFDRYKTFSAFIDFPVPLDYFFKSKEEFNNRKSNLDKMNYIYFNINYVKSLTEGYTFSFVNKPTWTYSAEAQLLLPWNIKNSISYYILPNGTWEIYQITKPIQQFDISFQKMFLDKKLKVVLQAFDVFNAHDVHAIISATNLETNFYKKQDTRSFRISLTYNFGNLKLQKDNTDIQTEKVKGGGSLLK